MKMRKPQCRLPSIFFLLWRKVADFYALLPELVFEGDHIASIRFTNTSRYKRFCYTKKTFIKIGIKIFYYNNKMFVSANKTFGCCSKIFGCSNNKLFVVRNLLP